MDLEQLNASCCFLTRTCCSSRLSFRRLYTATSPRAHLISLCLTHCLWLKCLLLYHYVCVILQTFFTETRLCKFCRHQECMKSTSLVALLVCLSGVPGPTGCFHHAGRPLARTSSLTPESLANHSYSQTSFVESCADTGHFAEKINLCQIICSLHLKIR